MVAHRVVAERELTRDRRFVEAIDGEPQDFGLARREAVLTGRPTRLRQPREVAQDATADQRVDRGAAQDTAAQSEIDQLNDAYGMLQPDGRRFEPQLSLVRPTVPAGTEVLDRAVDWLSAEAQRTRHRWPDRNPEIAVIGGVTLFLAFIGLAEGVSFWLFLLCLALVFGAIWAPWRRV